MLGFSGSWRARRDPNPQRAVPTPPWLGVDNMIKLLEKYGYLPRIAVWELTLRCNLNCRHCGSRAGRARDDELGLNEALTLADDLAEMGCQFLTLSGGEPLLRKDWPIIAQRLIERGVTVGMVTNGILWNDAQADLVRTVGLETVAFSVDGFQESHEYQRRVRDSGSRCSTRSTVVFGTASEPASLRPSIAAT